jgi:hypothetical protein
MGIVSKKQKNPPFLAIIMNRNEFFKKLKIGDVFTYSGGYKTDQIEEIAILNGLNVEYCKPRSPEYIRYGSFTMKVVNSNKIDKSQIFHFDLKQLDI